MRIYNCPTPFVLILALDSPYSPTPPGPGPGPGPGPDPGVTGFEVCSFGSGDTWTCIGSAVPISDAYIAVNTSVDGHPVVCFKNGSIHLDMTLGGTSLAGSTAMSCLTVGGVALHVHRVTDPGTPCPSIPPHPSGFLLPGSISTRAD